MHFGQEEVETEATKEAAKAPWKDTTVIKDIMRKERSTFKEAKELLEVKKYAYKPLFQVKP